MEGENIVYKRTLLLRKCNKSMYTVVLHPKYTKLVKVQLCKFAKGNKTNREEKLKTVQAILPALYRRGHVPLVGLRIIVPLKVTNSPSCRWF